MDGEPRRSLAGHVDLGRTYTGSEWPLRNEGFSTVPRTPNASSAPGEGGSPEGGAV